MIRDWLRSSMGVFGCFGICVGLFCLAVWMMWQIMEFDGSRLTQLGQGGPAWSRNSEELHRMTWAPRNWRWPGVWTRTSKLRCTCSTIGIVRKIKSFACGWRLLRRARLRIGYGPSRKRWTSNSLARVHVVANLPGPRMRSCTSSASMPGMLAGVRAIVLRTRWSRAGLSSWGWRHSVPRSSVGPAGSW